MSVLLAMTGMLRAVGWYMWCWEAVGSCKEVWDWLDNEGKRATGFYNVAFYIRASAACVIQDIGCKHIHLIHI